MSLFGQLNTQGSVLRASMHGHAKRNEVISNNIANADVPGFRARRVEFEASLKQAVGHYPHPRHRHLELSGVGPTIHYQNPGLHYRIDGNNVDIDHENLQMSKQKLLYDFLVQRTTGAYNLLRHAITEGRG